MSAKRLYFMLWGVVGLSIVVLFLSVYFTSSLLEAKAKDVVKARAKSMALDQEQQQLTKARADIAKYKSLAEIAKSIVPQDKDQAQTIREIVKIAGESGIRLGTISFPTSTLGDNKTVHSQLKKVADIPGVYSLEITIQSDSTQPAPYSRFVNFLDALEHNRRTALVNGITLVPEVGSPNNITFTLNLSEYIKP